jgi:hypothetical protein
MFVLVFWSSAVISAWRLFAERSETVLGPAPRLEAL